MSVQPLAGTIRHLTVFCPSSQLGNQETRLRKGRNGKPLSLFTDKEGKSFPFSRMYNLHGLTDPRQRKIDDCPEGSIRCQFLNWLTNGKHLPQFVEHRTKISRSIRRKFARIFNSSSSKISNSDFQLRKGLVTFVY